MDIERNINNLKQYIEEDDIYKKYKEPIEVVLSDFDMFCINHCKDIEEVLKELDQDKSRIKELEKENETLKNFTSEIFNSEQLKVGVDLSYEDYIPKQKIQDK